MTDNDWPVVPMAVPSESRALGAYANTHLADAYAIRLPDQATTDPEQL